MRVQELKWVSKLEVIKRALHFELAIRYHRNIPDTTLMKIFNHRPFETSILIWFKFNSISVLPKTFQTQINLAWLIKKNFFDDSNARKNAFYVTS